VCSPVTCQVLPLGQRQSVTTTEPRVQTTSPGAAVVVLHKVVPHHG